MTTCTTPGCRRHASAFIKKFDRLGRPVSMPRCEICIDRRNVGAFRTLPKKKESA